MRYGIAFVIGYLAYIGLIRLWGWLESVWRITWKPMLGSLLCAVALGFMFDTFVPNANTMVDVVRVLTS